MLNKIFWNPAIIIGAITVYAYTASFLMQLGRNTFFNTHQSLVEVSIRENIFWFFIFLNAVPLFISSITLWQWFVFVATCLLILVPFVLRSLDISWLGKGLKWIIRVSGLGWSVLFIIFVFASLQMWYKVGYDVVSNQTAHLVLASGCDFASEEKEYIATSLYDGKAVLVLVDKATNKMEGKFFVKNLTDLTCGLEYKEIGKIEQ